MSRRSGKGTGRAHSRGKRRRRCELCGGSFFNCCELAWQLELKNRANCDIRQTVESGAVICDHCVHHNGVESQVRELPVACADKQCHACGGNGRVRRKVPPARRPPLHRAASAFEKPCPGCNGEGRVPA